MTVRVACIGGLTLDWVQTEGKLLGPYPGGNALYSAIGVSLAGGKAYIVAHIGEDYPQSLLSQMQGEGLGTEFLESVPGNSYMISLKESLDDREVRLTDRSGTIEDLEINSLNLPEGVIDSAHVCGAGIRAQRALLGECRTRKIPTTLDLLKLAGEAELNEADISGLVGLASAFIPSRSDLAHIWPQASSNGILRRLQEFGCQTVVLRLGAKGAIGCDGDIITIIPAIARQVVDTTGAGDAFCGAFHVKWQETRDLTQAMAWGTACASIVIEQYGALHALNKVSLTVARRRAELALAAARGSMC